MSNSIICKDFSVPSLTFDMLAMRVRACAAAAAIRRGSAPKRTRGVSSSSSSSGSSTPGVEALAALGTAPGTPAEDFNYRVESGIAMLNHGSFGGPPNPVIEAETRLRASWNAYPDEWYYSGRLDAQMAHAADTVASELGAAPEEVCLMGAKNAAFFWSHLMLNTIVLPRQARQT